MRHSVEAFFTYHIHASRLFHMPTFMASLELLPTDPRFPSTAVLHAMCAVGSLYSAAVPSSQTYQSTVDAPCKLVPRCAGEIFLTNYADELFEGRWRKGHPRPDYYGLEEEEQPESFTEQQARFSKQVIEVGLVRADFQCLQGTPHEHRISNRADEARHSSNHPDLVVLESRPVDRRKWSSITPEPGLRG